MHPTSEAMAPTISAMKTSDKEIKDDMKNIMDQLKCSDSPFRLLQINKALKSLRKFSGSKNGVAVDTWIVDVEVLAIIGGWSDFETFHAAKQRLSGAAGKWIEFRSKIRSWRTLKQELVNTFQYQVDEYQVLEKLREGHPKKGESLLEYMYRMRCLADKISISENLALAYTLDGIPVGVFNKAGLENCSSFDQLKNALAAYDAKEEEGDTWFQKLDILGALRKGDTDRYSWFLFALMLFMLLIDLGLSLMLDEIKKEPHYATNKGNAKISSRSFVYSL